MIKLQTKMHSNLNDSKNMTTKTEFGPNPYFEVHSSSIDFKEVRKMKNLLKLEKFASRIFGHTTQEESARRCWRTNNLCRQEAY